MDGSIEQAKQLALIAQARAATSALRDAARTGTIIDFRERDPLVMVIHQALDLAEHAAKANR